MIKLNVGGTLFTTTVATLTKYPYSMLAIMFNPERRRAATVATLTKYPERRRAAEKDDNGNFFLDRNPRAFEYILEFLRNARLPEDIVGCSIEQVEWEADYFGLQEILKIIGERKKAKKEKEEKKMKLLDYVLDL